MDINRITSKYVAAEDRFGLSGVDAEGRALVLWLTQRLLNRLVSALCRGLEKHNSQSQRADVLGGLRSQIEQGFAQQKAMANLAHNAPVTAPVDAAQWRVDAVDIVQGVGGVRLTFKGSCDAERASLVLSATALRQWLTILFSQYRQAGWSTHAWPVWMEHSEGAGKDKAISLH